MKHYNTRYIISHIKWAAILCVVFFFITRDNALMVRIVNSIFLGGLVIFAKGGLSFASYLGGFDLFSYSHKKLKNYSRKKSDDENEPDQDPGSYYEYINNKKKNTDFLVPLSVGGIFMIISAILTIFC